LQRIKKALSKADAGWRKPQEVMRNNVWAAKFSKRCVPLRWRGTCLHAEFKKGASAELNRDVGTLLKAYQEEVDRLTTR